MILILIFYTKYDSIYKCGEYLYEITLTVKDVYSNSIFISYEIMFNKTDIETAKHFGETNNNIGYIQNNLNLFPFFSTP